MGSKLILFKSPANSEHLMRSDKFHIALCCNQFNARAACLFALLLSLSLTACRSSTTVNNNAATPRPSPTPQTSAFDETRAFAHVRRQVEFGPRPAGSSELAQTREYIASELRSYGLNVSFDEWRATTPVGQREMVNITAELPGESSDVIIISSHYDTKLIKEFRFVGANDGASSTGAVMEIARVMASAGQKRRATYRFVFFDGEEAFCKEWTQCRNPDGPDNTYGSRRYVEQLKAKNETQRVRAMILLDMIGYKELRFGRDDMSSPDLVEIIWQTARSLGHDNVFVGEMEGVGGDDHEPFLRANIKAIDIIQLNTYPYWHTVEDTLDKISPRSLKIVGDVVINSLPRIEERVLGSRPG
ncbi:MAG: Zn-dependent exopeptidase M28 [Pyrinomonadaceae bacterium]|nr:Zn-dependent exopeptidase M28 [Pyrinomonadaceae bacterium]